MRAAIGALPRELYSEAVSAEPNVLPDFLKFNGRYRDQLMRAPDEGSSTIRGLSQAEMVLLQAFQNLMHIRYPYINALRATPELFKRKIIPYKVRMRALYMKKKMEGLLKAKQKKK